ncbi:hypothetical protein D3C87_1562520 [compost metagenome]|uniref:hypothetical protein n=1 Tax=Variovorax boronicumulans TaxID=436515 RepID=UPI000F953420|nr:hypothetical protein [Variovorax boronicumulans]GER15270.1 hypothetical protein VCH24_02600 [Variovorax boronicumulans]
MKTAGRLVLGSFAWAALIPLGGFLRIWLIRSGLRSPEAVATAANVTEGVLILLAALLYWRCVPSAPGWGQRVTYFVGFVLLLASVSTIVCLGIYAAILMPMFL